MLTYYNQKNTFTNIYNMEVNTSSTPQPENMYDFINGILMNPSVFIILTIVVVGYIIFFLSLGSGGGSGSSTNIIGDISASSNKTNSNVIFAIMIGVVVVLLLLNGLQYFMGLDVIASLKNIFNGGEPTIDIVVDQTAIAPISTVPEIPFRKQVFNIPGNYYGYEDAKSLCTAYGARLANYEEIEDSYEHGGEWCNYGWSEGQMALYPTQKNTYDNLQNIKGHEHDCGRPGINGGYIANPAVKFGVNCYGYKPKITTEEEEMMQNMTPYPKTAQDIAMEKRVDYWKTKLGEIIVSPFNYDTWSRI
jgi:Extracellular link domain